MKNRRFWTTDYPVLCYPSTSEKSQKIDTLVMSHLCDPSSKQMKISLFDGLIENKTDEFLGFVDIFIDSQDCKIAYLVHEESQEKQLAIKFVYYKNPFLKKAFNQKKFWATQEVRFECNAALL